MTKIAIIGAGSQAKAVLDYFIRFGKINEIGLLDKDPTALSNLTDFVSSENVKLSTVSYDIESNEFVEWLSEYDAAISCAPYFLNKTLTKQAIKAKTSFTDLGGNNDVVRAQLAMSDEAKEAGILVVPDLGLAPGMAGLLGADLARSINDPKTELKIRVGGLPVDKNINALGYGLFFSVHGLLNEYLDDCEIIKDGKKQIVNGLSGLESIGVAGFNYGQLEAFYTSGGISTLTDSLLGLVKDADYKTIRFTGHHEKLMLLKDLGWFDEDQIENTKKRLENYLPKNPEDWVIMYIYATNYSFSKRIELVDFGNPERGLSAMAKCTGYPAAIITSMIARGEVGMTGAIPQENCIDVSKFKLLLKDCDIILKEFTEYV